MTCDNTSLILDVTVCSLFFFIGLFNIYNKILIGIDILLEWRQLFKEGFPLTNVITAKIKSLMMKVEEVNMKSNIGIIKAKITKSVVCGRFSFEKLCHRNKSK